MKIIVHIGMPKAGSTALQGSLQKSAAYLAQRGLLYPENPPGRWSSNHQLLQTLVAPFEALGGGVKRRGNLTEDNVGDKVEEFFHHIRRQIETQRPAGLILSTENLFRPLQDHKHEALRARFNALGGAPRFVAYLRQPSAHYLSSMQQRLKSTATVRLPRPLVYRRALESYDACFGPDAVSARLFHRDHLEQGDIVADFCKHYLAEFEIDPAKLLPGEKPNETLSAESMDILARYRQTFHAERDGVSTKDTVKLIAALAEADSRHGAARPRLRPGVAETIDYASHDCLWVRDRFGVVFPDLDYDRLAAAPVASPDRERTFALEELIVIDRERQAQILDSLAQSPWTTENASNKRKVWLNALRPPSTRARPLPPSPPGKTKNRRGPIRLSLSDI